MDAHNDLWLGDLAVTGQSNFRAKTQLIAMFILFVRNALGVDFPYFIPHNKFLANFDSKGKKKLAHSEFT